MGSHAIGLILAAAATAAIFGAGYVVIYVLPAASGADTVSLMRWGAAGLIGAILLYRLYSRFKRRRARANDD